MSSPVDTLSYEPLDPVHFLTRAARVFGHRTAVVDNDRRFTYRELEERSLRLAGALAGLGAKPGDRIAVLAPNTPLLLESHYAVPAAQAVLVALNIRLRAGEIRQILDHSGATILLCDRDFEELGRAAADLATGPIRLVLDDEAEALAAAADQLRLPVVDERGLLAINYTSGTTGQPKGVMYHYRGAFLQALSLAFHTGLDPKSAFLWTLPMFHCNGWCFTWAVTAAGARHVCLRKVDGAEIWRLIAAEGITHLNAAPTVLTMIAHDSTASADAIRDRVRVCTGGAPPSPTLLAQLDELGFDVTHLYGLTETFGPITICEKQPDWDELAQADTARLNARQGVGHVVAVGPRVVTETGEDVPADGETIGEIALRGNGVMLGYYRAPELTADVAPDGWFRTGDLAVMHPDGYLEIRDRSKDVIISGGENIPSVEVEQALVSHPAVSEAAVVAAPDERWGEVPVAFVTLKAGQTVPDEELIGHVKEQIAGYKAPKRVVFGELPKTSTGKIQKYALREQLWADQKKRVN